MREQALLSVVPSILQGGGGGGGSFVFDFLHRDIFQAEASPGGKDDLAETEGLYLQSSFNAPPSGIQSTGERSERTSAESQFAVVPGLRRKLEELLLCVADNLLNNCCSPDVSGTEDTLSPVSFFH